MKQTRKLVVSFSNGQAVSPKELANLVSEDEDETEDEVQSRTVRDIFYKIHRRYEAIEYIDTESDMETEMDMETSLE
jgi:hypothetical protein